MLSRSGGLGRLLKFDDQMKTPSLGLVLGFWVISNVLVIAWYWVNISDRYLPGLLRYAGIGFYVVVAVVPLLVLYKVRRSFFNPVTLGLLVSCCLALSITAHEANLLREQMQFSLDHEREFAHMDAVEGVMRPLLAKITEAYVQLFGDDHTHGGSTYHTHIIANYLFDSLSFLAVFALATLLLSPTASWLCLLTFAFYTQTAMYPGRMGPVFIAGGLFWQLFLLTSRRYPAAVISGLIISFGRTDVVFASAFSLLALAAFERRWPTLKEWVVFGLLIGISLAVPKMLIWMHPGTDYRSFLVTNGDFSKLVGNLQAMKLVVAIASPVLAIAIVRTVALTRTIAVVGSACLVHVGLVFFIADFSETRLIIPGLAGLVFVASEGLGKLLEGKSEAQPASG
ncbi:hypothetical protein [Bradyrhizobium symbiodeficiens]|uniref:hypothetical protein n=1 Tax=Bradyrhizobium symbiodeficiens TaxID=1404367 RepID=UPI000BA19E3D|nr:hypothetical protein [Bradyrhizobium symbiodeficiens]AWM08704.1 hypothetical protein CIT39_21155 [Bradyrhizobium symbiodeficiens]